MIMLMMFIMLIMKGAISKVPLVVVVAGGGTVVVAGRGHSCEGVWSSSHGAELQVEAVSEMKTPH